MNYEKYEDISISSDFLDYKFTSVGKRGNLNKVVKFNLLPDSNDIYNLSLGTIEESGTIDFITISKNGDRNKILGTIGATAHIFSNEYPKKSIFLTGDTKSKTRLYQMAIHHAYDEINETFDIYGLKRIGKEYVPARFRKGRNYEGFLFKRKPSKEEG